MSRIHTPEEILAVPTDEMVNDTMDRLTKGAVRRRIPAQPGDDDIVISNVVTDWRRLRASLAAAEARVERAQAAADGYRQRLDVSEKDRAEILTHYDRLWRERWKKAQARAARLEEALRGFVQIADEVGEAADARFARASKAMEAARLARAGKQAEAKALMRDVDATPTAWDFGRTVADLDEAAKAARRALATEKETP